MGVVRVVGLRIALHQATPLRFVQGTRSCDALGRADLEDSVKVRVQRVREIFSFHLSLDLLVDVELQRVGLPVFLHLLYNDWRKSSPQGTGEGTDGWRLWRA